MSQDDRTDSSARTEAFAGGAPARRWAPEAGPLRFADAAIGRARTCLAATFEREMEAGRGFLWLPVAFGAGILAYFVLPREPWLPALAVAAVLLALAAWRARAKANAFRLLVVLAAIAAGLFAAKARTDLADAPAMTRQATVTIAGWIAKVEEAARGGKRVRIRIAGIDGLATARTPTNVRVTIRSNADALAVGDAISVLASLAPPSGPVMPGGYDFSFVPFYERIGGIGFAFGSAKPADIGPAPLSIRLRQPLEHLRETIRKRIVAALPGDYGHIAAALVMGDQRGIAAETHEAMRASGLGHILSISGLHMVLVAGSVFWLVRAFLALSPRLALNHPIKKWAAVAALAIATLYLGISGAEVATVRSYVMLAIMLAAILLDRRALTLRNVALAALVILVFSPESLLSISFQMSFAATIALIVAYQALSDRTDRTLALTDASDRRWSRRVGTALAAAFLTALVAGLATAPFAAFYFQRVAPLTIIANMAVAPAIGFVVMPSALLATLVMPFGLEAWPLAVMRWGLVWMVSVAETTAAWSAGWDGMRAPPAASLFCVVAGFLWLTLWRERWRFAGLLPLLLAVPIALGAPRPDLIVDEDGSAVAIRRGDGRLAILGGRGADFEVANWLRADGDIRMPAADDLKEGSACDELGCIGEAAGIGAVAFVLRREAFAEDCRVAAVVVTRLAAPPNCALHALVIDREQLDRFGAHAIYAKESGPWLATAYPETRRPFMPPARD